MSNFNPTQLYRNWCKTCNDFTLHERIFEDEVNHPRYKPSLVFENHSADVCDCGTSFTPYYLSDCDEEKVLTQRERYKKAKSYKAAERLGNIGALYMSQPNFFSSVIPKKGLDDITVHETDAGLKEIIAKEKEERIRIKGIMLEELSRFSKVNRNDECLCGSGLKYKKCCLQKHLSWKK